MDKVQQEADRLYKKQYGKMIALLLNYFRDLDLETAEDIVQDAFSVALTTWKQDTIPANAEGWIFRVCKNKALNKLRTGKRTTNLSANEEGNAHEMKFSESSIDDPQLKLLFACAHPDLSPKVQVVITLKYVANLKVEAIARILGMTIDGVDKLLVRARQKIKDEKILFEEPPISSLESRLPIVHKILYLVFNEGYKSSWGRQLIREELCEEALVMTKILLETKTANNETAALYALMLFNAARFRSRFSSTGALLDLEEQDRGLWNMDLIMLACANLEQSKGDALSAYHYEASIAYLHCTAKNFYSTDWHTITKLYFKLLEINPNPFVELNYAIALYYSGNKTTSLDLLHKLRQNSFLNQYYLLNATLGKIYLLEKDHDMAKIFLAQALEQTSQLAEKDFIKKMMDRTGPFDRQ